MDTEADDDITHEVEISIVPREMKLAELGIVPEMFEAALGIAIDEREAFCARDDVNVDDIPALEEMPLVIGGVAYKLEDLADVEVSGWDA